MTKRESSERPVTSLVPLVLVVAASTLGCGSASSPTDEARSEEGVPSKTESAEGWGAFGPTRITLKGAVAVREAGGRDLRVYLYPFDLDEEDIGYHRIGQPWHLLNKHRRARDPDVDQRLNIMIPQKEDEAVPPASATAAHFNFTGFEERSFTRGLLILPDGSKSCGTRLGSVVSELRIVGKPGMESLIIKTKADDVQGYSWDFTVSAPIVVAEE